MSYTVGSVILESPAIPVIEEGNVTLCCRNKMASSNFKTDFYKYGHPIHNSSTGNVTIHRVSKSDEGLYKCGISGVGESSESWLSVRGDLKPYNLPVVLSDCPSLRVLEAFNARYVTF